MGDIAENLAARPVEIKVLDSTTGRLLFRSKSKIIVEPGGAAQPVELQKVKGAEALMGQKLDIRVLDSDDEEVLDRVHATLRIALDEWD